MGYYQTLMSRIQTPDDEPLDPGDPIDDPPDDGGGGGGGGDGDGGRRAKPRYGTYDETMKAMAPFYDPAFDAGTPGGRQWYQTPGGPYDDPSTVLQPARTLGGFTFPEDPTREAPPGADETGWQMMEPLRQQWTSRQLQNTPGMGEVPYGVNQLSNYGMSRIGQEYGSGMLSRYGGYRDLLGRGL